MEAKKKRIAPSWTVNQAQQDGKLSTNERGLYKQVFDVWGYPVMVRSKIVNGLVRIGTAWIPPHPWGLVGRAWGAYQSAEAAC
jgi:hypothetical protein